MKARNKLRQKSTEARNAMVFVSNFTRALRDELVHKININELENSTSRIVDKGERIKHRNNSENVLNRVCQSSKNESQPVLWTSIIHRNKWYNDEGSLIHLQNSSIASNSDLKVSVKKIKVDLNQNNDILPGSRRLSANEKNLIRSSKFENKEKTNLRYFTSKIHEIPGPITSQMKKIMQIRKHEFVEK